MPATLKPDLKPDRTLANGVFATHPSGIPPRPDISVGWEWVDPPTAELFLTHNFDRNRGRREPWIFYLAQQMDENVFYPSHQGIAFDPDGFLLDGQHRLAAIALSGKGQWMLVARGVPRQAVMAMDRHARRTESDQIRVAHADMNPHARDVAVARMMLVPSRGMSYRLDGDTLVAFLRRHADAIKFSQHYSKRRGTASSPIRSVVARAWYHVDRDRLLEFLRVLETGEPNGPEDFAATKLRNALESQPHLTAGHGAMREETMRKTVSAVKAFLERRSLDALYAAKTDPYPLPKD